MKEATEQGYDLDKDDASTLRYAALGQEVQSGLWAEDPGGNKKAGDGEFSFVRADELQRADASLHKILVGLFNGAVKAPLPPSACWLSPREEPYCIERTDADVQTLKQTVYAESKDAPAQAAGAVVVVCNGCGTPAAVHTFGSAGVHG